MKTKTLTIEEQKILVAKSAVDTLVQEKLLVSGMKLGLGTGSTAMPAVSHIAHYIKRGVLTDIAAVPTSFQTSIMCESLDIPVFSLSSSRINGKLDLAIDGADEVDKNKYLIKGGGAALLQEKIIAYNSQLFVVIGDSRKVVSALNESFPLPIEIIPDARLSVMQALKTLGAKEVVLREAVKKMGPVVTDNGNFILDVIWDKNEDFNPLVLESKINAIVGVVENGFFTQKTPRVFIAQEDGSVLDF